MLVQSEPRNWPARSRKRGLSKKNGVRASPVSASVWVMRVRVPSPRCGSIWKMPPAAQSLACSFMLRPGPVREISAFSASSWTDTALVSDRPRWSGTLLA